MKRSHELPMAVVLAVMMSFPSISSAETKSDADQELVNPEQLSQIIDRPKQYKVPVTRDPFEPLVKMEPPAVIAKAAEEERQLDVFKGMEYAGVVKWGDAYSAYLRTDSGKGVYQVNDRVGDWTITDISEGIVTFKSGEKSYQLQRGDK